MGKSGHARVFNFDGQSWNSIFEEDGANGYYSGNVLIYHTEMTRAIVRNGVCKVPDRSNSMRKTECTNARDKGYEESISLFQSEFYDCDCSKFDQFARAAKQDLLKKIYKADPENSTLQDEVIKICARDGVGRYIKDASKACNKRS